MAKLGRKCKLTPELQSKICKYIEDGNYAIHACQAVGITTSTFYDWIKQGELDSSSNRSTKFSDFYDSIKESEAKSVVFHMSVIHKAGKAGEWAASMTWLERRFPDMFGKRQVEPVIENKILIQLRDTGKDMLAITTNDKKLLPEASVTDHIKP